MTNRCRMRGFKIEKQAFDFHHIATLQKYEYCELNRKQKLGLAKLCYLSGLRPVRRGAGVGSLQSRELL